MLGQVKLNFFLRKYRITMERYSLEKDALEKKGYSPRQIERLILRSNSSPVVALLLENHGLFVDYFGKKAQEKLTKIAAYKCGFDNILALIEYTPVLIKNFSCGQILSMAGCINGSKNLKAVVDNFEKLNDLGFTVFDIHRIVSTKGGSHNLNLLAGRSNLGTGKPLLDSSSSDEVLTLVSEPSKSSKRGREDNGVPVPVSGAWAGFFPPARATMTLARELDDLFSEDDVDFPYDQMCRKPFPTIYPKPPKLSRRVYTFNCVDLKM